MIQLQNNISLPLTEETVNAGSRNKAIDLFMMVRERLLDVNNWHVYGGMHNPVFSLTNYKNEKITRSPQVADIIRIDFSGTGPRSGKVYGWVRVETLHELYNQQRDEDYCGFRLRFAPEPDSPRDPKLYAMIKDVTISFIVQRLGNTVTVAEKGSLYKNNQDGPGRQDVNKNQVIDPMALLGLNEAQSKQLVKGLLGIKS